jgi:hypothetical protein
MKVHELIELLKTMPKDARVFHLWDGEPRTEINAVWLSKKGHVVTADYDQYCYSNNAMPVEVSYDVNQWKTIKNPNEVNDENDFNEIYPWD